MAWIIAILECQGIHWKILRMGLTVPDYRKVRRYFLPRVCADLRECGTSGVRDFPRFLFQI